MDGVQFVLQPYRTTLNAHHATPLKTEIAQLAQAHGGFVRLFNKSDNQLIGVFSADPGFLLGENVWLHFECPEYLVYAEELEGKNQALLVVVNSGIVILDSVFELVDITDVLTPLLSEGAKYTVYTYGNVQITSDNNTDVFGFTEKNLALFKQLDEPLFTSLHVTNQFQLLPLSLALDEHRLNKSYTLEIIIFVLLIIVAFSSWLLMSYLQ
jgi:hypothetical protein